MKEQSIVEIIVYLMEVIASSSQTGSDHTIIKKQLEHAGFSKEIIANAFNWLKQLIEQQSWYTTVPCVNANRTLRIFNLEEICKISSETRGFILSLEYAGVLDTGMREVVINQLMQLNQSVVNLVDAKWVVLLVLMSKSNRNIQQMRDYLLITTAQDV